MKSTPLFIARVIEGSARDPIGTLYWFDLDWGNTWGGGCGYIGMVPFGEEKKRTGYCQDNRVLVDPSEVEISLAGWTREVESEDRVELIVGGR